MVRFESNEQRSVQILRDAHEHFGDGLWMLSSFGANSALTLHLARLASIPMQVLSIDTGFRFSETVAHQRQLERAEQFAATLRGVTDADVREITNAKLWQTDLDEYNRRTKTVPLSSAIQELGVAALVTGVYRDQTSNRAELDTFTVGADGEARINAVLDWTHAEVEAYFTARGLLRHPLHSQGYESIGDWTLTNPGEGRDGRNLGDDDECGINIVPGENTVPPITLPKQFLGRIVIKPGGM